MAGLRKRSGLRRGVLTPVAISALWVACAGLISLSGCAGTSGQEISRVKAAAGDSAKKWIAQNKPGSEELIEQADRGVVLGGGGQEAS